MSTQRLITAPAVRVNAPFQTRPTRAALILAKDPMSSVVAVKGELAPLSAQPAVIATMIAAG